MIANGYGFTLGDDKNVLKSMVVVIANSKYKNLLDWTLCLGEFYSMQLIYR